MPSKKKALQAAAVAHSRVLEPNPPANLWEELDALCVKYGMVREKEQPPGTFTAAQYARKCGLHASSVSLRFQRLLREGKLEYMGRGINNEKYYRIKK